jgi:hypothetical protein
VCKSDGAPQSRVRRYARKVIYALGFVLLIVVIAVVLLRGDKTPPSDETPQIDPPGPPRPPRPQRPRPAPVAPRSALVFARGLVLSADATSQSVQWNGQSCEQRDTMLDVEIPGQEPYVVRATLRFQRGLVRVAPGDALDLNIDPNDPSRIVVLGPGGFTGPWLRTAQSFAQPGRRWS